MASDTDFGQALAPQQGTAVQQLPKTPAETQSAAQNWFTTLSDLKNNPDAMMFLMTTGMNLLSDRPRGVSERQHVLNAVGRGGQYLGNVAQLREKKAADARKTQLEEQTLSARQAETEARTAATQAGITQAEQRAQLDRERLTQDRELAGVREAGQDRRLQAQLKAQMAREAADIRRQLGMKAADLYTRTVNIELEAAAFADRAPDVKGVTKMFYERIAPMMGVEQPGSKVTPLQDITPEKVRMILADPAASAEARQRYGIAWDAYVMQITSAGKGNGVAAPGATPLNSGIPQSGGGGY